MAKAVLDTTVLVSALLRHVPGGASCELLRLAQEGAYELYLSDDILEETARVLLTSGRLGRRYRYSDADAVEFCQLVAQSATIVSDVPELTVVRDPNDDMIVACAVAAQADYLVARDRDMLSLGEYEGISIVTPEEFLHALRQQAV